MKKIGLFKPYMSWRARLYALRVLMGDMIGEGPVVKQFEKEFGDRFAKDHVLAVNSGTTALELAYHLAGIKDGDEVITTVLTCTATNLPLARLNAKILFIDIDRDLNIKTEYIERNINERTRAIVFTHFGGNNRGLEKLLLIVKRVNLEREAKLLPKVYLIEDAAQAVGSDYWGKGDFTAVSLQAIKTLTSVDGGILICKEYLHYQRAKKLRWYGYDRALKQKNGDTDLVEAGWKYHMNDVTAAIGLGNLRSFDKPLKHRKMLAKIYSEYGITAHAWLAVGRLDNGSSMEAFRLHMAFEGIEVGQHHFRNDKYSVFESAITGMTPLTMMDAEENRYVFLPYHTGVSAKMAHKIGKLYQKYR